MTAWICGKLYRPALCVSLFCAVMGFRVICAASHNDNNVGWVYLQFSYLREEFCTKRIYMSVWMEPQCTVGKALHLHSKPILFISFWYSHTFYTVLYRAVAFPWIERMKMQTKCAAIGFATTAVCIAHHLVGSVGRYMSFTIDK